MCSKEAYMKILIFNIIIYSIILSVLSGQFREFILAVSNMIPEVYVKPVYLLITVICVKYWVDKLFSSLRNKRRF